MADRIPTHFLRTLALKLAPDKPIIIPEWGATNNRGKKASFISEAFDVVPTQFTSIKAML